MAAASLVVTLVLSLIGMAQAKAFLQTASLLAQERISEEDVQTSLLAEIEGTFGAGSASSRVKHLEETLGPIYKALPKNGQGYLGHATVRYALHRLFIQKHGWSIKGLDVEGGHRNSTSGAGLLKEQVPAYVQGLFEKRLGGRGFGLHELGVLAATIEHLVHAEAVKRLGYAFKVHDKLPTSYMSADDADSVLDTYMTAYILGEDLRNMTLADAHAIEKVMPEVYKSWADTQKFVRETRRNVTVSEASAAQQETGDYDFSLVARVADRIGERFGKFQDQECQQIKADLVKLEMPGTGRVRLSDFYKPALEGHWQFQESVPYLRQLGALDESDAKNPQVIIANYISSPSNCIASSSSYSVCCIDECEGLLGHLEQNIAAPEATSTQIAALVSELSSSSVTAPRKLSDKLLTRLGEIAANHGGAIPLHGRLFAQWMHHAFPRECPYPHLSGTTNPQTPDEWLESTGIDTSATDQEMRAHIDNAADDVKPLDGEIEEDFLPWSPTEELLVERVQPIGQSSSSCGSVMRNFMQLVACVAMAAMAYGMIPKVASGGKNPIKKTSEKYLV